MITTEVVSNGTSNFFRVMHFGVGDMMEGHKHTFDHYTALLEGCVEISVDGNVSKHTAPDMIYINKDKFHKITALEDNTVAVCMHVGTSGVLVTSRSA